MFGWWNTDLIHKHLNKLNKGWILALIVNYYSIMESTSIGAANFFNSFFNSVFSSKETYELEDVKVIKHAQLTNFSLSKTRIQEKNTDPDVAKSEGSEGIPLGFFLNTRNKVRHTVNINLGFKKERKNFLTYRKKLFSHIRKNGTKTGNVTNCRRVSPVNFDSDVFDKCIYDPFYQDCATRMTDNQHAFVRKRSVLTNKLQFLQDTHRALDKSNESIKAFFAKFSEAPDRVTYKLPLRNHDKIGDDDLFLDIISDYLEGCKHFVSKKSHCSE